MLELADEFIDDVTHFACRLARHRGSDTLDVRDLQLHLGSSPNAFLLSTLTTTGALIRTVQKAT